MHIFYIDDSKDEKFAIFSAIAIPGDQWRKSFEMIRAFRAELRRADGIPIRVELHATHFVAGRGSLGADRVVPKGRRCQIFKDALSLTATLPGVMVMNSCCSRSQEDWAFERLLNRINKAMERASSQALIISDEGKEGEYTRLARRLAVFNPIKSQFGAWEDGATTKNLPLQRIVEDIFFKDSRSSYFVQLADFCAYALLRRENPLASKTKYGLDKAFELLGPVLNRNASQKDPDGIIRC